MGCLKGITYCILWYMSIFSGYVILYCPLLPLLLLSNKLYRRLTDSIFRFWELYPTALLQFIFGTRFIVTGDQISYDDMSVLVMNHRTRTDWNFLWPIMYHAVNKHSHNMKYVLKDVIKHFPGPGWVMQLTCFLYIKRNWENDRYRIKNFVHYLFKLKHKCQILVFPEGTDLTPYTLKKSSEFADKYNLERYKYVLHPRTTGFSYLVNQLQKRNQLDAIYDLTLGYPDVVPQTEKHILRGRFPKEVHCHIKKYTRKCIPTTENELREFLNDRWKQKELALKDFYVNRSFGSNLHIQKHNTFILVCALIFWTLLPVISFVCFVFITYVQLIFFSHSITLIIITLLANGFVDFEIFLFRIKNKLRLK